MTKTEQNRKMCTWLLNTLQPIGRTAYVGKRDSADPEPLFVQALVLIALTTACDTPCHLCGSLAGYLSATSSERPWASVIDRTLALIGLSIYDAHGRHVPSDHDGIETTTEFELGVVGTKVVYERQISPSGPPFVAELPWPLNGSVVWLKANGIVDVAITMEYTPVTGLHNAMYRGIWVTRQVFNSSGHLIPKLIQGRVVTVRLECTAPSELTNVEIQDILPGGTAGFDS